MRILLACHHFWPNHRAGVENYVGRLARAVVAAGAEVGVLTTSDRRGDRRGQLRRERVEGLEVLAIGDDRVARDFSEAIHRTDMAEAAADAIRGFRPDILHVHHFQYLGLGLLGLLPRQQKTVLSLHDFWLLCGRKGQLQNAAGEICVGPELERCVACLASHRPGRSAAESRIIGGLRGLFGEGAADPLPLLRRLATLRSQRNVGGESTRIAEAYALRRQLSSEAAARADLVLAPSVQLRDRFRAEGFNTERWRVHMCGVSDALFQLESQRIADRPLEFGWFGSLVPSKGAHLALEAFLRLPEGRARLTLRGSAKGDPAYARALRRRARGRRDVCFLPPFGEADLTAAYAAIDCLLVTSTWLENAPFVILEARAASRPILAHDLGGMAELVADHREGRLVPPGDVAALAGAMAELVHEPEGLRSLRGDPRPVQSLSADAAWHLERYRALLSGRA